MSFIQIYCLIILPFSVATTIYPQALYYGSISKEDRVHMAPIWLQRVICGATSLFFIILFFRA